MGHFLAHHKNQQSKWFVWCLSLLIGLTSLVLIILVATSVIDWTWITGYLIAAVCSTIALFLVYYSYKVLVKTENYYTYLLLFIARLGLYFIPFIFVVFIPGDVFSVFGVLVGFSPIILLPLLQGGERVVKNRKQVVQDNHLVSSAERRV